MRIYTANIPDRQGIRDTAEGIIAQSNDRQNSRSAGLLTDGVVYFSGVGLRAGDVISKVSVQVTVGSNTSTVSRVGVYDKAGNRLGTSFDQGTTWAVAGVYSHSVYSATATSAAMAPIPTTDLYYLAVIAKASVTLPTMILGNATTNFPVVGSGAAPAGQQTGQTDLPNPATISTAGGLNVWLAAS